MTVRAALLLTLLAGAAWAGDEAEGPATAGEDEAPADEGGEEAPDEEAPGGEAPAEDAPVDEPSGDEPAAAPPAPEVPAVPDVPDLPDLPALPDLPGDSATAPVARGAMDDLQLNFGGFVGFDYHQYLMGVEDVAPEGAEAAPAVTMVRVAPTIEARYRFVRARAELEFRHDFHDAGRGNRVIVREAVAGLQTHGFRLEGGALLERWGKMDVNSPTDNLVALDNEELFFPEPLPVPGILVGYARGPFSVQGIFIPVFEAARFRPDSPSRWNTTWSLPRTEDITIPTPFGEETRTVRNNYFQFEEDEVPGDEVSRLIEGGLRVDLFLPNVDLGVSFASVHDRLPTYTAYEVTNSLDTDGNLFPQFFDELHADLKITPFHRRLYIPGMDVAVTAGPFVFKGEAAYFQTEDADKTRCIIDDPYVKYAAGVELMLNNLVGEFDFAARVQYNGDITTASADEIAAQTAACPGGRRVTYADPENPLLTDDLTGFQATPEIRHPFTHAWYWNLFFGFTPELSLDLRGYVDIAGDALIRAKLAYTFAGALEASVGTLVMLNTAEGTIFAPYANNHRIEAGVLYRF